MSKPIRTYTVFSAVTIAASGTSTSTAIDLNGVARNGNFSLQVVLTGSGTAKFEYSYSNDGTNYIIPASPTGEITTGHTVTSGPGTDGKNIYPFSPQFGRYMKVKATETGAANSVTITCTLAVQ